MTICFSLLLIFTGWFWYRRLDAAEQIVDFFGFDPEVMPIIEHDLAELKRKQPAGFRESVLFFKLDKYRLSSFLSEEIQNRVVEFWCKKTLFRRSIAWPYIHYPAYGDKLLCDGLIKSSG